MRIKENELYQEIALYDGDTEIGRCEVELKSKKLFNFRIYEPYRNKGYGTAFIEMLNQQYGLKELEVDVDNKAAIRVYEKNGFKMTEPSAYIMKRGSDDEKTKKSPCIYAE